MDDGNSTTTRLITLLNISAVKTGKRKCTFDGPVPVRKLNQRKSVLFADASNDAEEPVSAIETEGSEIAEVEQKDATEENESQGALILYCILFKITDENLTAILESYERHFGMNPVVLTQSSREAVDRRAWALSKEKLGKLGSIAVVSPDGAAQSLPISNGQKLPVR